MNAPFPWFGRLSRGLKTAWVGLMVMLVLLFALSARYQLKKPPEAPREAIDSLLHHVTEFRRESNQEHEEIRRELERLSHIRVGTIEIPQPDPKLMIGGIIVILDMTGARSLDDPRAGAAAKLFDVDDDPQSLVNLVRAGKVRILELHLYTPNPEGAKGGVLPKYAVQLDLQNLTNAKLDVKIADGQIFENTTPGTPYQNLAIADPVTIKLDPLEVRPIPKLLAYCINKGRRQPANQAGYLTPLKLKFADKSQEELWDTIGKLVPAANQK